jgi:TolB-like protein/tetratricopeptide (TPR) repeat protein
MKIWNEELKELNTLQTSLNCKFPDLEKELEKLIASDDENVVMLYSRRCLEVIITELCVTELNRPRRTEPLKGIIDKLNKEEKVPSHIITSMDHLNGLSNYGAHPKDFDREQVKPVLNNLSTIIKWYCKSKDYPVLNNAIIVTDEVHFGETLKVVVKEEKKEVFFTPDKLIKREKSIIVLPFENISPDPDQEYFSDGLTEEIITDLSQIHDLLVISRSSAMTFKGTKMTIPEIARVVNVKYVLEGSVRKAGYNLRITAQLIDSESDTHIWADKYTGTLDDVFDIQENVSKKIVEALTGHLTSKGGLRKHYDKNAGVYDVYSRAHYEFWKNEPGSLDRALNLLEKAVEAFGEHPLLLSGIGAVHWQFYHQQADINDFHLTKIEEYANKLFTSDPNSAQGHRLMSYIDLHSGNTADAIRHLYKSMHEESGDTETLLWLSYLLAFHAGRPADALPIAERWRSVDPLHLFSKITLHFTDWMNGNYQKVVSEFKAWGKQEPDNQFQLFYHGHILTWTGQYSESLILAEHMCQLDPGNPMGQCLRFLVYSLLGEENKAINSITPSGKEVIWMDFHLPWLMAEGYSVLGKPDEALLWLERAIEKGIFNFPLLSSLDPLLCNIRDEPRFKKMMDTLKIKWENFSL